MNISIKTTGNEFGLGTREFVEEKLRAVEKHIGKDSDNALLECEIEESIAAVRAGAKYRAEGTLRIDGETHRIEALSETLEGAVDRVRDGLAREARKSRARTRGLTKRGGAALKRMLRFGR